MKAIFISIVYSLIIFFVSAQRMQKFDISNSGVSAYFPTVAINFEKSFAEDSSIVYTGQCIADSLEWGLILVDLNFELSENNKEEVMIAYLDYLKNAFQIDGSAGYGKGHTSERNPGAKGVIDFWDDEQGNNWKIKGWVNKDFIAVLYITGPANIEPNYSKSSFFLDGILFSSK